MSEIRAALAVGKEVIVHTDPISVPGWSGAGYVIFDAETGAGAWKIGGGGDGGFLDNYPSNLVSALLLLAAGAGVLAASPIALFLTVILVAITVFHVFMTFITTDLHLKEQGCPEALGVLHLALSVAFAALPVAWGKHLFGVMVSAFYAFMVENTVKESGRVCSVL